MLQRPKLMVKENLQHTQTLPFLLRLPYNCSVLWGMDAGVWMHCLPSQHFLLTSDLLNEHFFFSS